MAGRPVRVLQLVAAGVAKDAASGWEETAATDWAAVAAAVAAAGAAGRIVVLEGFRVLDPAAGPALAELLAAGGAPKLWLEVSKSTCRARRERHVGNGPVSADTFESALWPRHLAYREAVLGIAPLPPGGDAGPAAGGVTVLSGEGEIQAGARDGKGLKAELKPGETLMVFGAAELRGSGLDVLLVRPGV